VLEVQEPVALGVVQSSSTRPTSLAPAWSNDQEQLTGDQALAA
jgi:hypothetical protein